jgi:FMN phosphatase YigB (HAD superfamily)
MRIDLSGYKKLGIDFDDTLIDHPNSQALWDYITRNEFGQEFHIVTFRSGGLVERIFPDLALRGCTLDESHFIGVHTCPHELWQAHHLAPEQKLIASLDEIPDDPYVVWKGMICAANDIPVLIDDMTHNVIHGCRKHGIVHIHPDDL